MKKIVILLSIFSLLFSCDDGDFDVPGFNFDDQVIQNCGDLVLFKINESESLVFRINESNVNNAFFNQELIDRVFDLNNISYRIYSDNITSDFFCNDIPPSTPILSNEWTGSGSLVVNNTITFDDKDNVEELNLKLDFDLDEIPDYYDFDDDNDGIKTINELTEDGSEPIDTDGDNIIDFLDTDKDGAPNYLDIDDDNDGIPTINELKTDSNGNGIVDYLDGTTSINQPANPQLNNTHTLSYFTTFNIDNLSLENSYRNVINFESYDFGLKAGDVIIIAD